MREESDAKGLVFVSSASSGAGVSEPEPVSVDSSREVVPVARIRCTR